MRPQRAIARLLGRLLGLLLGLSLIGGCSWFGKDEPFRPKGPQLGAILSLAASEASVTRGTLLLAVYALGNDHWQTGVNTHAFNMRDSTDLLA